MNHNPDAERAVISLAISNPLLHDEAGLSATDFYLENHQLIWMGIGELVSSGTAIDTISISVWLERMGSKLVPADVARLASVPATTSSLSHYAELITNAVKERKIFSIGHQIIDIAINNRLKTEEKISMVGSLISNSEEESPLAPEQVNSAIKETITLIEERFNSEGLAGLPTGLSLLDKRTNGLNKSNLILLAARPSMGKTVLALNISTHASVKLELPVLFFSLEMSKTELVERCISSMGSINYGSIRSGKLKEEEWTDLSAGVQALKDKPLYIDDTAGLTLNQIRSKSRSMSRKLPLSLIVIDYLQLIRFESRSKSEEIGEISRSLKELAKELNVPILCLSQLNRSCEQRGDKRPGLSDLRDSGSLEQDADLVMFIHREEVYDENTEQKGVAEIITRKFRAGQTGTDYVESHLNFQRFSDRSFMHVSDEDMAE